jgi:hypothetical protein
MLSEKLIEKDSDLRVRRDLRIKKCKRKPKTKWKKIGRVKCQKMTLRLRLKNNIKIFILVIMSRMKKVR